VLVSPWWRYQDGAGGDEAVMPAPFSPDPADRSSVRTRGQAPDPSTQTDSNTHDPHLTASLASPTPPNEPPTVISGARPRKSGVDSTLGESLAGRKLGHFELIEAVGAGGMGAVLKARDLDLGRIVALKILPPDMASDPENIVRFKQEARAAAKLDHDNVARVYHFGEDQGLHFIAFEFVEGDNLRQLMDANDGTIPVPDAVALMLDVSAGLAHAAERGVVHRDIKPSNIIVTPDGRAKIVDMGLARSMDARAAGQLTESGVTLGTFDYISPEQAIEPRSADVRSDIYSLGCTFYHALTGHTPVPDGTPAKKLDAQKNLLAPDPRSYNPDVPADLAVILGRMMAKDPDSRYQHPDHLCAHLRSVAKKLGLSVGVLPPGASYDSPLPQPPRLSATWILTSLAVLALAIAILTNAFQNTQTPLPPPNDRGGAGVQPDPFDGGASVAISGSRDAVNVDELISLLKQGVKHVRLTGLEYDLVRYRDPHPVDVLLSGDDVRLEGVHSPSIRLGYAPDGKARSKTLTLRGPSSGKGTATVKGIRFVLPEVGGDDEESGLLIAGFDRVVIEDCTFSTGYRTARDGPASLGVILRGGSTMLSRCYFAPGCVGLLVDGPGRVSASECAIAPQLAGVRVIRSLPESVGETELSFDHCSALLSSTGAVVEIGDGVPCSIRPTYCLFAGPDRVGAFDPIPAVVRQVKTRATSTRYEGNEKSPNGYYNIAAYAEGETTYSFAEAAREKLPIKDVEGPLKFPWDDRDPYARLAAKDAAKAFKQNLRLADLRVQEDPNRAILGTQYLGAERLYPSPFPSTAGETRDLTIKVWDPSLSEDDKLPLNEFPTLARALAAIRRGDTLLIRHTGRLEIDPLEFTRADTHLTIKPDANCKPVLVPAPAVLKRANGLFKLYGGPNSKLILDGLQFVVPADRAPSVAVLPGGGQLELRNSVITMEEGDDLAAIMLSDPRGEMMMMGPSGPERWPVPKVTIENVFIRGRGRLLSVKGSRPFELDVKNSLVAVDHSLIDIEPSSADPSAAGSGIIRLNRMTAYLGGSLLQIHASEKKAEMGPMGLARTELSATQCVFAPANGNTEPFVRADRIDSREQAEKWLTFRGKNNVYGHDKKKALMELRPADLEAMPLKPIDGDRWLEFTLEEGDPFTGISFEYRLPEAGQTKKFLGVRPIDFRTVRFDPVRPEGAPEVGSAAEIPVPFADE
jgi:serine/threonine protein kinase